MAITYRGQTQIVATERELLKWCRDEGLLSWWQWFQIQRTGRVAVVT